MTPQDILKVAPQRTGSTFGQQQEVEKKKKTDPASSASMPSSSGESSKYFTSRSFDESMAVWISSTTSGGAGRGGGASASSASSSSSSFGAVVTNDSRLESMAKELRHRSLTMAYGDLMSGYCFLNDLDGVLDVVRRVLLRGLEVDELMRDGIVDLLCRTGMWSEALRYLAALERQSKEKMGVTKSPRTPTSPNVDDDVRSDPGTTTPGAKKFIKRTASSSRASGLVGAGGTNGGDIVVAGSISSSSSSSSIYTSAVDERAAIRRLILRLEQEWTREKEFLSEASRQGGLPYRSGSGRQSRGGRPNTMGDGKEDSSEEEDGLPPGGETWDLERFKFWLGLPNNYYDSGWP